MIFEVQLMVPETVRGYDVLKAPPIPTEPRRVVVPVTNDIAALNVPCTVVFPVDVIIPAFTVDPDSVVAATV